MIAAFMFFLSWPASSRHRDGNNASSGGPVVRIPLYQADAFTVCSAAIGQRCACWRNGCGMRRCRRSRPRTTLPRQRSLWHWRGAICRAGSLQPSGQTLRARHARLGLCSDFSRSPQTRARCLHERIDVSGDLDTGCPGLTLFAPSLPSFAGSVASVASSLSLGFQGGFPRCLLGECRLAGRVLGFQRGLTSGSLGELLSG
jgi:hypothetical protein